MNGTSGQLPLSFLDVVNNVLYKNRGTRTQAGSYLTITLLCINYRLLTKMVPIRLGSALARVVSLEQSALITGALSGPPPSFSATLHTSWFSKGRSCLVAFVDIAKAYDILDQDYIFAAMDTLGAGPGHLASSHLLLSTASSSALVKCHSYPCTIRGGDTAGVSPGTISFLFAAQALLSWLQHCDVGICLAPVIRLVSSVQVNDDIKVMFNDHRAVSLLLKSMDTFALASGQHLNLNKERSFCLWGNLPWQTQLQRTR